MYSLKRDAHTEASVTSKPVEFEVQKNNYFINLKLIT